MGGWHCGGLPFCHAFVTFAILLYLDTLLGQIFLSHPRSFALTLKSYLPKRKVVLYNNHPFSMLNLAGVFDMFCLPPLFMFHKNDMHGYITFLQHELGNIL